MTDAAGTPSYLEQAAAEAAKAARANDKRHELAAQFAAAGADQAAAGLLAEAAARSLEIAEVLTRIAAIEAGLPPCHHPLRPARETP